MHVRAFVVRARAALARTTASIEFHLVVVSEDACARARPVRKTGSLVAHR
jgi:hypothetical protein